MIVSSIKNYIILPQGKEYKKLRKAPAAGRRLKLFYMQGMNGAHAFLRKAMYPRYAS